MTLIASVLKLPHLRTDWKANMVNFRHSVYNCVMSSKKGKFFSVEIESFFLTLVALVKKTNSPQEWKTTKK